MLPKSALDPPRKKDDPFDSKFHIEPNADLSIEPLCDTSCVMDASSKLRIL